MTSELKVSVLTPIYNVEKYLGGCLDSLDAQTLDGIEFICINDGSTDASLSILQEYASRNPRFVIIDKPNSGYGASMNQGLEIARGEYIGIVESDDFAEPEMFEKLYQLAHEHQADVCKSNFYNYNDMGGSSYVENFDEKFYDVEFRPVDAEWQGVFHAVPAIWSAVYRRQFLIDNDIRFNETPGAAFQDTGFVLKSWIAAQRAYITQDAFLHYRLDRDESSVKSRDKAYFVCSEYEAVETWLDARPHLHDAIIKRLQACKLGTYLWNANRLEWSIREDFLIRAYSEFKKAGLEGYLDPAYFTKARWKTLQKIVNDPYDYIKRRQDSDRLHRTVNVTVIVPMYNAEKHLEETLKSLQASTLARLEFILVDDGSTDRSRDIAKKYCKKDSRFKLIMQDKNRGVGAARNQGLFFASGTYIAFCDSDDLVPAKAYEKLYKAIELHHADMAIGAMREFSPIHSTIYPHTSHQSNMDDISRFDINFNWSLTLNNKIFVRKTIIDNGITFDDRPMGEDSVFLMHYLDHCNKIVGAHAHVYDYRKSMFLDEHDTATDLVDRETLMSHCQSFEDIVRMRLESFDKSIDDALAEGDDVNAENIRARKAINSENLRYRYCTLLIDRYYRHIWNLDEQTEQIFLEKIREQSAHLTASSIAKLDRICESLSGSKHEELPNREKLAKTPMVSIIIAQSMTEDVYERTLESLYAQQFPAFQVIVPASFKKRTQEVFASKPNLSFLESDEETYLQKAVSLAQSAYVNILQDDIYHARNSLEALYRKATLSRADFVACSMQGMKNQQRQTLRGIREVYRKSNIAKPSKRSLLNTVDCSANNKLFKKYALVNPDAFEKLADGPFAFVRYAYRHLSFERDARKLMVSQVLDPWFYEHAPKMARFAVEADNIDRFRKSKKFAKRKKKFGKSVGTALEAVKPTRKQVLFTTNRADGLTPNLQLVFDALEDVPKLVMCDRLPHSEKYQQRLEKELKRSSVIVTDDYCHALRTIKLKDDQHVVQLWHAAGAFKKFGLDYIGADIRIEKATHKDYDLVCVSSEEMRPIYAHALGVRTSIVKALGVPRTDILLEDGAHTRAKAQLEHDYPALAGKRIIAYCPTFRQSDGRQITWDTGINWCSLNESLPNDAVMVVKKHPLETYGIVAGAYSNIQEIDTVDITVLQLAADLMITDYSSVIFDCALIGTPIILYCPDLDSTDTDFYLDFPTEITDEVAYDTQSLTIQINDALNGRGHHLSKQFVNRYMGSCDGQSTERIAHAIRAYLE